MRHCAAFFYTNYGLFALTDPVWLHGAFETLTSLFDRVGLRKKSGKTFGMIYCPCHSVGTQLESAYEWRMTGEEIIHRVIQMVRVQCPEFGEDLAAGYLEVHWQNQHGVDT